MFVENRRVMVVEDEPLIALMLEDMLRDLGWEVAATAYTESEAMAELDACRPSLAILDINLGRDNSLGVAAKCFERAIPVVFTTGYVACDLPHECGSAPVLTKPFSPLDLAISVERALHRPQAAATRIVETAQN